jgi:argininosuccinate lyase
LSPSPNPQTIHPLFTDDVTSVWSYETSVERKNSAGGTAKSSVLAQIATVKEYLQGLK